MKELKSNLKYIQGGLELIDVVKNLWEKLNNHHKEKSIHFKEHHSNLTYDMRKEALLIKSRAGKIKIDIVKDIANESLVGYCISTISSDKVGEVDSLYVETEYRGQNIGDYFMEKALEWMDSNNVVKKQIGVAAGNDKVYEFYKRYNFYPRVTMLVQK